MKAIVNMLILIIICICVIIFASCDSQCDPNVIYCGNDWVVKKVNDTTLICVPQQGDLLGRKNYKPYIININDFNTSDFK